MQNRISQFDCENEPKQNIGNLSTHPYESFQRLSIRGSSVKMLIILQNRCGVKKIGLSGGISGIIMGLAIYSDIKITPENTLIIFDEVQEVPFVLTEQYILSS